MSDNIAFSVVCEKEKKNYGKFALFPLPAGFGNTVGTALRRTLLMSLPGAAATQIKIAGAAHLFTTLKGVREDLVEVMLNIKQIRFIYEKNKPVILKIEKKGPGEVRAGDIKLAPGMKVANPDLVLATLADKKTIFKAELTVGCGVGYELSDEHKSAKLGVIAIDSVFTPIVKANCLVEPMRKGKKANFDKLFLEIWTDRTISPKDALKKATAILVTVFKMVLNPKDVEEEPQEAVINNHNETEDLLIEEIGEIPLRMTNALKKAGLKKVKDLVAAGRENILKTKNVGEKSFEQLSKILQSKGVEIK